jgi:RNA polymerase sigma factor (sigma-70 family)
MFQQPGLERQQQERADPGVARFWEEFAHRHGHELVRCVARAMRRVGWRGAPAELDELVQEVYCRILEGQAPRGLGGWPPAQLWSYLHRIAKSVVVDELRSRGARKRGGQNQRQGEESVDGVGAFAERRAPGPTAEERLLVREEAAAVRRRVRELGAEHGARNLRILELAAVEGYTAVEISHRLAGALTASSVHTVLYRLRRQLSLAADAVTS